MRRYVIEDFMPAYSLLTETEFSDKIAAAEEVLRSCRLCPRECGVDRTSGQRGYCRTGDRPFVSSWGPHFGEERPLVGRFGSGTIFFANCNLGCVFCQNYSISQLGDGAETSHERLAGIMLALQDSGCRNINLVTPTHQVPAILKALRTASERGLRAPLVYNSGGYETPETLGILDGIVDLYMPDFKYSESAPAAGYSDAPDYPEAARVALREMHRQVGDLAMDEGGNAKRGLLVRHLVLPGGVSGTADVARFLSGEISRNTYVNIMDQYHPCWRASDFPPLDRRCSKKEFGDALEAARKAGLHRLDGVTV